MRNRVFMIAVLALLPLFTGCTTVNTLQILQDRPEDLQQLLEQKEFARVRQLTGKYPSIDTPELQALVDKQEAAYANSSLDEARTLESENDLYGAVLLLSDALQKIPHNDTLREYRNRLESERLEKIRIIERQQLIARAEYTLNQEVFYQQQHKLESPNLIERWEQTRNTRESESLARQLRACGAKALGESDLQNAMTCLQLSKRLDDNPETRKLLDQLIATKASQQKVVQKQASLKKEIKENKLREHQENETRKLLETTRQALSANELAVAKDNFILIPAPETGSSEVRALGKDLDSAIGKRVAQLTSRGDSRYRADDVDTAIRLWSEALKLEPENKGLRERLERAARVLARLEELRQQQRK